MIVKEKEKQISFQFQESDPYFEMGYTLINQINTVQVLPYQRTQQFGREMLVFSTDGYKPLKDAITSLSQSEIINVIYAMMFMVEKIEENGFLKKECIWFDYNYIYFDEKNKKPMFAILPINEEIELRDGRNWSELFVDAISHAASVLAAGDSDKVKSVTHMWSAGQLNYNDMLEEVNSLGNGNSSFLVDRTEKEEKTRLTLLYSGHEGKILFEIGEEEFIIGKNPQVADGVITFSEAVSRTHCKIIKMGQKYFVQDIGSTNHTFVNGEFIPHFELGELEDNATLSVADVDFRVHIINNY